MNTIQANDIQCPTCFAPKNVECINLMYGHTYVNGPHETRNEKAAAMNRHPSTMNAKAHTIKRIDRIVNNASDLDHDCFNDHLAEWVSAAKDILEITKSLDGTFHAIMAMWKVTIKNKGCGADIYAGALIMGAIQNIT